MLILEKALKARRRQLGVSDGVLDRLVAQIALDGARIDAVVRQFVAAAMPQHVWVDLHVKARRTGGAFHHGLEAAFGKRRAALADKYEGRLGSLLTLQPPQGA